MLSSCAFVFNERVRAEDEQQFAFPAEGVKLLKIDTYNGDVDLTAGGEKVVLCNARFYATGSTTEKAEENLREMKIVTDIDGDIMTITVPRHSSLGTSNVGAALSLTIPAGIEIDIETSNGSIETTTAFASPRIRTSNGNIILKSSNGPVNVRTSNGRINLTGEGNSEVKAKSSNGSIFYNGNSKDFELVTSNGRINIELPGGWDGIGYLHTSNGSIEVNCAGRLNCSLKGKASNGKIHVLGPALPEGLDSHITLKTSNGSVQVNHQE